MVRNQLSGDQRSYLAAGGLGFIIGDGALHYASEKIFEAYYAVPAPMGFTITGDYQRAANPAYNQDRGPVSIYSLRIHWESRWRR
jgi:high affinity Mn2+ porin